MLRADAELQAIRSGEVDHVLVSGPDGPAVFSLLNAKERDLQHDLQQAQSLARLGSWTCQGGRFAWSQQMYELHDRDPGLGPPALAEYFTLFAGAGAATSAAAWHAALGAGRGFDLDLELVGGKWCHLHAQPVRGPDGLVVGLRGTAQDMTASRMAEAERKAVEEQLRFKALLLASVGQAVIATDASGRITYWGPGAVALYGWEPAEVQGRLVTEVTPSHTSKAQGEEIMANLATGKPWSGEFLVERKDGSSFIALVNDNPILDDDGQLVGVIGVSQDMTASRKAEGERERLRLLDIEVGRLKGLNKMRTDFLNAAAHDLNNPLTPIMVQLAVMARAAGQDEQQQSGIRLLRRNFKRLQVIIQDMLVASRLQSGRMTLHRKPCDLQLMLVQAIESFEGVAGAGDVGLRLQAPPATLSADQERLGQVVYNLLSNAVKYTPAGGSVDVALTTSKGHVGIRITDSGLGMTPEQLQRLFQPFVRLHEHVAGSAKGTGLGLYICKGLIEAHGGRIWATSPGPGRGTTFHVELPIGGAP